MNIRSRLLKLEETNYQSMEGNGPLQSLIAERCAELLGDESISNKERVDGRGLVRDVLADIKSVEAAG